MSAEKLEPGWYWVKYLPACLWEAARFDEHGMWKYTGAPPTAEAPCVIGPRIEPPGE